MVIDAEEGGRIYSCCFVILNNDLDGDGIPGICVGRLKGCCSIHSIDEYCKSKGASKLCW